MSNASATNSDKDVTARRRILVAADHAGSFHHLRRKILLVFPKLNIKTIIIAWKDEEGDDVLITSDEELAIARCEAKSEILKLNVTTRSKIPKSSERYKKVSQPYIKYKSPGSNSDDLSETEEFDCAEEIPRLAHHMFNSFSKAEQLFETVREEWCSRRDLVQCLHTVVSQLLLLTAGRGGLLLPLALLVAVILLLPPFLVTSLLHLVLAPRNHAVVTLMVGASTTQSTLTHAHAHSQSHSHKCTLIHADLFNH